MHIQNFNQFTKRILENNDPDFPDAMVLDGQYSPKVTPPTIKENLQKNNINPNVFENGSGFFGVRWLESGSNIISVQNHWDNGKTASKNLGLADVANADVKGEQHLLFEFHYILRPEEEINLALSIFKNGKLINSSQTYNFKSPEDFDDAFVMLEGVAASFYSTKKEEAYQIKAMVNGKATSYFLEVKVKSSN
jgi:hypothetical protein